MNFEIDNAWEAYEEYFTKRKNEIMSKLQTIKNDIDTDSVYKSWLDQTIEFIKEWKV